MNKSDLLFQIDAISNAKRIYRDKASKFVIDYPETFPFLIELAFDTKNHSSVKAAWVLELVCHENLNSIEPFIDFFIDNLQKIKAESALRPIAKICNFLLNGNYYQPKKDKINTNLTEEQRVKIIESNFDWLIEDHKIASQVFAMDNLYFLSKNYKWISDELKLALQKDYPFKSAGYQAHARKILKEL